MHCGGDLYSVEVSVDQSYNVYFYCYRSAIFTIQLLERYTEILSNVSADYHDCDLDLLFMKQCTGSGTYTISGEGTYNISTLYGNASCFGDVTLYSSYATTDGPFCCQGHNDTFVLDGHGYLYDAMATYYDNCSSLIDSTDRYISYDAYTVTSCRATGAYAFVGNGYFNITVDNTYYPNVGLKCDGSVSDLDYLANGTLHVYSYGQFACIASGYLSINGTGFIEGDELYCYTTRIIPPTPPPICFKYVMVVDITSPLLGIAISGYDNYNILCNGNVTMVSVTYSR